MGIDTDQAVRDRYSAAAQATEPALCCPVDYDARHLEAIPQRVLDRDYGCGDPSSHLRPGETVLDLGSGGGKICFIASQVVGSAGRVIGVDMNPVMLALARSAQPEVAERIGHDNVEFREGRIQDLGFDPSAAAAWVAEHPLRSAQDALAYQEFLALQRAERPLVASASVDVVVSNCVLNLVSPGEKRALFAEIHRVVRTGGRAVISDIVSDESVPEHMRNDADLWSGCISGALREDEFLRFFAEAGFHGVRILERSREPWQTVQGIEFRSLTVEAFKGDDGPCWEGLQAVIYKGPFAYVEDDDGHRIPRGVRYAVCRKTFDLFAREPYREMFEFIEPRETVEGDVPYECETDRLRHPRETKGEAYDATSAGDACEPGCC